MRDEGTSHHYLPPATFAEAPDSVLLTVAEQELLGLRGISVHRGPTWTTDAPYRETEAAIASARDLGALAVEMEAAVLFTLGALRKVHAGCLLTVSDIVVKGEFTRISDDELRSAVDRMTRVGLATVTTGH